MFKMRTKLASAICLLALTAGIPAAFSLTPDTDKKDGTVLAYTNTSRTHIEASIVCDSLTLKYKDGKTKKLSLRSLNSKGATDVTAMWNLFTFYIVKDIWRGLIHSDKVMGQANISLEITSDGKHKVTRKAVYIPGCKPCLGNGPLPAKAQEFWKGAYSAVEYIEFKEMKIPDFKVASATMDVVFGRDREVFPRYPFCDYQGILKRDKEGYIYRAKILKTR